MLKRTHPSARVIVRTDTACAELLEIVKLEELNFELERALNTLLVLRENARKNHGHEVVQRRAVLLDLHAQYCPFK